MIRCENIGLSFAGKPVFDNLDFSIEKGENVCLSAPSGKGKSTLLKMLAGYVIPDRGQVVIDDKVLDTTTIRQIRDSMIWIPQNINLPVENGVELMKLLHLPAHLQSVNGFLQKLGLEQDMIRMDFSKISGGEKQRIVISICLSFEKEIILIDEPTSSLDDDSIELLINTIQSLDRRTIVSASHHQKWVESADKVITL
ncbi:MAG: ABC transporter ATP-binding protein [Bacteroidota bacterium]